MDARYGPPPAPPPGAYGNIPTQKLPTQMNQFDTAPSCVQNAMMTKDKKPFTYTPGGIDLSQIKSPRMAKRIARNAQNEGVTGTPRPSPLAKPNGTENGNHSPSMSMGAAAMGMPFQVFPTPPPPPPQQRTNGNIPPPPPPSNLAAPGRPSANNARKSPTPQSFDPPPMGFRPEIKIPVNPMAALKKVPRPQEKNDFWVEEYKKERSKSPMVERNDSPQPSYPVANSSPIDTNSEREYSKSVTNDGNAYMPNEYQPEIQTSNGNHVPKLSNGNSAEVHREENDENEVQATVNNNRDEVDQFQPSVYRRPFENQSSPQQSSPQVFNNNVSTPSPKVFQNQPPSPSQSPAVQSSPKPSNNGIPSPAQSPAMQSTPKPIILNNVVTSPAQSPSIQGSPKPMFSSVTPPSSSPTVQSRPQLIYNNVTRDTMSPFNRGISPQPQFGSSDVKGQIQPQKNAQVGSIYIPPVPAENLAYKPAPVPSAVPTHIQQESQAEENSRPRQTTPLRWMASRPNAKETPEWAKEDNVAPSTINRPQSMYKPQNYTSNQPQTNNNANFSTTNTYQPSSSPSSIPANTGLRLQIQSVGNQPKERIIPIQLEQTPTNTPESPKFTNYSPRSQPSPPSGPTFVTRNPNQFVDQGYNNYMNSQGNQNQARVIPIAMEMSQGDGQFNNSARGPVSPAPVVIQNNSRGNNATAPTGNTTPNQSKSFRILQKITSTEDGNEDLLNEMNQPAELQRPHYSRMMANTPQQQSNNAALEQLHRMQQNSERGRQGPPMKYPQPPTYVQQRAPYQNDNEQYIPPSQQQAPEPKIYTGSAIPSRSFKLLQAMTTPENAAEMEGSDVEQILSNDDSLQSLASSSHFPSQSSFNSRPNSFCSGGTVTPNIIVTPSDDEDAQVIELLSHKLNELSNSSSSENNFDAESIDENNFYIREVTDSDNYSDGSFDHIDAYNDYGHMMRSMKSMHNINEEDDESDIEEIHLEVIHEDLSIIDEEESHFNKSNDSLLSDGTMVDDDFNDINEVTARLPLRLSFSKSQNDEDVATVEVGDSQYEDKRGRSLSITSEGYPEITPKEETIDQWQDVDDFWGTTNHEEVKVERKNNYKKAMELFSKPSNHEEVKVEKNNNNKKTMEFISKPLIPTTVELLSPETTHPPQDIPVENEWQETDDFWGTKNTVEEEEGRKSNYKNAMSFFTTTIEENTKVEPKEILPSKPSQNVKSNEEYFEPCSKGVVFSEPSKEEKIESCYEEVNDFWGASSNVNDESKEHQSNYKNARSFFAADLEESSTPVNVTRESVKSPLKEKKWWEYDDPNTPSVGEENKKATTPWNERVSTNDNLMSQETSNDIKEPPIRETETIMSEEANSWWEIKQKPQEIQVEVPTKVEDTQPFEAKDSSTYTFRKLENLVDEPQSNLRWWETQKHVDDHAEEQPYKEVKKEKSSPTNIRESESSTPMIKTFNKESIFKKNDDPEEITTKSNYNSSTLRETEKKDTVNKANLESVTLAREPSKKRWWETYDSSGLTDTVKAVDEISTTKEAAAEVTFTFKKPERKPSEAKKWWDENPTKEVDVNSTNIESIAEVIFEHPEKKLSEASRLWATEASTKLTEEVKETSATLARNDQPVNRDFSEATRLWATEDSTILTEEVKETSATLARNEPQGWWETDVTPTITEIDKEVSEINSDSNCVRNDQAKGWWETDETQVITSEIAKEVSESTNLESPCVRNDQPVNEAKGWWETQTITENAVSESTNSESTCVRNDQPVNEAKGWWETNETQTITDNIQEVSELNSNLDSTYARNDLPVNEAKGWWETQTITDNIQEVSELNSNLDSTYVRNEQPVNEAKGWWETQAFTENVEESSEISTNLETIPEVILQSDSETKGWWETDDTTTLTQDHTELDTTNKESTKNCWWESADVPTTIEEKPWWQNECEAPIWLNTEDLESNDVVLQKEPETPPPEQKEEVIRRSPSKAKEEINKRRSWWETRETSVEQTAAASKRFSLIEDDRKSVPKLEDLVPKRFGADVKMKSIKERIQMLETSNNSFEEPLDQKTIDSERGSLSRNSSQRSELESEVDEDSGVTDMLPGNSSQQISETDDTESENFPELRKMNRYTRAATHSRLFRLLQDENEIDDNPEDEFKFTPSKKRVIHNVSVTRRQRPELIKNAESVAQRRERLSLPLRKNTSIDNDNPSTPNSPRSPSVSRASSTSRFIPKSKEETTSSAVNEQLVTELVQSLLLKKDGAKLKNLPMEKLQAAAKRALEEQLDSLENTSIDSTPAITPSQDLNASDYSDYYDSWRTSVEDSDNGDYEIIPSKSFRRLQETSASGKRLPLARCPRVLSSRNVNRDLARVTESPEIVRSSSERDSVSRCHSASRWVKIS